MLRFGFIAQKYTEIIGIGNKEFFDNFEFTDNATISGCFKLRRSIPTHLRNKDITVVYNNLENKNILPNSDSQKNALFEYYMDLALNDPELDYSILEKLFLNKNNTNFKKFLIDILTYSIKLQNNISEKYFIDENGNQKPYTIKENTNIKPYINIVLIAKKRKQLEKKLYFLNNKDKQLMPFQSFKMNIILFFIHINYYVSVTSIKSGVKQLAKIIFGDNQEEIEVEKILIDLNKIGFIEGLNDGIIRLTDNGIKNVKQFVGRYWDVIETASQRHKLGDSELEILLCKYIVENMPPKSRIKNMSKILDFITNYYDEICWKYNFNGNEIRVPYHLIEKIDNKNVECILDKNTLSQNLEIDPNYKEYYSKRKSDKVVFNGIVYRLMDWKKRANSIKLYMSADKGYIDFQSTCGKLRNELDYKISEYTGDVKLLSKRLRYRNLVMHKDNLSTSYYLKKRVVKMGISLCTIITNKDEKGNLINPRLPIVFRNEFVAEYPSFSGIVPSGSHQPGFLVEERNESHEAEIEKRVDWKISAIRELGEELFDLDHLSKMSIHELFESQEYKIINEILENSLFFGTTGIGIDLYLGTCTILATTILEYEKVLSFLDSEKIRTTYSSLVLDDIKYQFIEINKQETRFDEGYVKLCKLDNLLMEKVLSAYFYDKSIENPHKNFPRLGPGGTLSLVYGKEKYDEIQKNLKFV